MDVLLLVLRILLAILLYSFLAAILLMLWRDLRQVSLNQKMASPKEQLVVLQAPDELLSPGTAFRLQAVNSIGRAPTNTLTIPDAYASAQHALLTWRDRQWWLEDQGSRNGTLLNGTRITSPTVVSVGDVIRVGRVQLKLEVRS